jgi:hypothetical protein
MKKFAFAFILLIVLVGISYLTSVRSQSKLKQQYDQGFDRGSKESQVATKRADSLRTAMEQASAKYSDSLKAAEAGYQGREDSLKTVLAQKDTEILTLKQKSKAAAKPTKSTKPKTEASKLQSQPTQASLNHTQILDYYKKRLKELPADLSEYERKVALAELRDETARKFSISIGELDKIRQNDSLKD